MNNKEFIAQLARDTGFSQTDTQQMVKSVIEQMGASLENGDSVQVTSFGTFEVKKRMERIIVNPSTQQRMLVPPKLVVNFRPAVAVKENLKK